MGNDSSFSKIISNLINNLSIKPVVNAGEDKIKVNNITSAAAFVYEKIRNAVDYNEDHLVRKQAIYRILTRKLFLEKYLRENYLLDKMHADNISEQLLQELIRGRYLENVPVKMIKVVDAIIKKYALLFKNIRTNKIIKQEIIKEIWQIAAVEIEQTLNPPTKEHALAKAMFAVFNARININSKLIDEKGKELQVYLTSYKVLFKWDEIMLKYVILSLFYPSWDNADEKLIGDIAANYQNLQKEFEKQLNHPWRKTIHKILNRKAIIFHIIEDIWQDNPGKAEEIFADPEELKNEIVKACDKRYKDVRIKLSRGVVRSIIYVFFTKMVFVLALELPIDVYLSGAIAYTTLMINVLFPPILMFIVAIMIRMPKDENTKTIIEDITQIVFNRSGAKQYSLKNPVSRGKFSNGVFHLIFTATFIFSIILIFSFLYKLNFNVFSSLIFILFLTLVSFFGIRIRRPVKELMAIDRKDGFFTTLIDFVTLPFVSMGRWLSVKFSKINVIAFTLDFIIEAPFKLLIEIFEELFGFLKEKKDDVMQNE